MTTRRWWKAALKVGLHLVPEGVHGGVNANDLRHTGNHLAAVTGASTKELMARIGHSTMRAALTYQHATLERDRKITDGLSEQIKTARRSAAGRDDTEPYGHTTGTGSASGA